MVVLFRTKRFVLFLAFILKRTLCEQHNRRSLWSEPVSLGLWRPLHGLTSRHCNSRTGREPVWAGELWVLRLQPFKDAVSDMYVQSKHTSSAERVTHVRILHSRLTLLLTGRLDFPPPVELTTGDSGATVSFPNPLHVYEELKQVTGASIEFSVCTESVSSVRLRYFLLLY